MPAARVNRTRTEFGAVFVLKGLEIDFLLLFPPRADSVGEFLGRSDRFNYEDRLLNNRTLVEWLS